MRSFLASWKAVPFFLDDCIANESSLQDLLPQSLGRMPAGHCEHSGVYKTSGRVGTECFITNSPLFSPKKKRFIRFKLLMLESLMWIIAMLSGDRSLGWKRRSIASSQAPSPICLQCNPTHSNSHSACRVIHLKYRPDYAIFCLSA